MNLMFRKIWNNRCFPLKIVGVIFFSAYMYHYPFKFEPLWVVVYIFIIVITGLIYINANRVLAIYKKEPDYINEEEQNVREAIHEKLKTNKWCLYLSPFESPLIFVPVLYFGLNAYSAAIAAIFFGLLHYPDYPIRNCILKLIQAYIIALLILPYGLLTVFVGHLLLDYTIVWLIRWSSDDAENEVEETGA